MGIIGVHDTKPTCVGTRVHTPPHVRTLYTHPGCTRAHTPTCVGVCKDSFSPEDLE